jgi:hypothetical protein
MKVKNLFTLDFTSFIKYLLHALHIGFCTILSRYYGGKQYIGISCFNTYYIHLGKWENKFEDSWFQPWTRCDGGLYQTSQWKEQTDDLI